MVPAKFCPFNDELHFHHDGCPSEWAVEERVKKAETELAKQASLIEAARMGKIEEFRAAWDKTYQKWTDVTALLARAFEYREKKGAAK